MSPNSNIKNAENHLQESEEKFKSLFNGINQPVFVHELNPQGFNNFIEVNDIACQRYGYSHEEFLKCSPRDISSVEDANEKGSAEGRRRLKEEGKTVFEAIHITKDGTRFPVEISSNIYNWLGRKVILSVAVDISERKRAEKALLESEDRHRKISELTSDYAFAYRVEPDGTLVTEWVTGALERLTGYQKPELKSLGGWEHLIYPDDIAIPTEQYKALLANRSKTVEYRILTKDKRVRWMRDYSRPTWSVEENRVISIEGAVQDITERKLAEESVRESEAKYRQLIESSNDAIYLCYNQKFELINAKFTELFGISLNRSNKQDYNFLDIVAPESKSFVGDRLNQRNQDKKKYQKYEFKALNAEGQTILAEVSESRIKYKDGIAIQGILRDITEKRRLEEQLQQSQKMEAIGTLAGGVAHDFNNLLTVINGYSELALLKLDQNNPMYNTIESILEAGKRAVNLTSQLLAFSRKQIYQTSIVEINSIVREMDKLLRRLIGEDINVETILGNNLSRIKADKSQLEQIFINLIVNARDAVYALKKPGHKPKITIETGETTLDEKYVSRHPGSTTGAHIFISVSDNGIGLDKEIKQKIFDPFFTTKDKFKGTGLGLATVYGIVKQNKGCIYVYSEPGQGTTFKIYWPVTSDELADNPITKIAHEDLSGSESILFVEDNAEVSRFAFDSLSSLGYRVFSAVNGQHGLDVFKARSMDFDLVVTDLIMPELNGREFVKEIKKIRPDIKVIYVSGHTDNHIVHSGMLKPGINFIQKPFSVEHLAIKIREVLAKK